MSWRNNRVAGLTSAMCVQSSLGCDVNRSTEFTYISRVL